MNFKKIPAQGGYGIRLIMKDYIYRCFKCNKGSGAKIKGTYNSFFEFEYAMFDSCCSCTQFNCNREETGTFVAKKFPFYLPLLNPKKKA